MLTTQALFDSHSDRVESIAAARLSCCLRKVYKKSMQKNNFRKLRRARRELAHLGRMATSLNRRFLRVPVGHFYSPLPDMQDVISRRSLLFKKTKREIPGIDIRQEHQSANLSTVMLAARDMSFPLQPSEQKRYYYDNGFFGYLDAAGLYGMMNHHRPARIVEVGSGFSSSVMLDFRDDATDYDPELTFIEPYPERLLDLIKDDRDAHGIIEEKVQDVDFAVFENLQAGDFLFIDSSHVSKIGSDVNYLFFEIISQLKPGVFVHVHDVLWPFEYPQDWVLDGRAWNEAYLLRALLTGNRHLQIYLHLSYVNTVLHTQLQNLLPPDTLPAVDTTTVINGTGIWLQTC